jgi:hypothetical protein
MFSMARIYFVLALFAITLLVTSVVLGLRGGDVNTVSREYRQALATLQDLTRQKEMDDPVEVQLAEARSAFDRTRERYQPIRTGQTSHFLVGLLAALVAVLINSISLTYFIGTSRWCREVVETYSLDPRLIERSMMIKRRNVPWALSGILLVLAVIALGGASDPGANTSNPADWVVPHRLLAIGATCWIGWAFLQQVGLVGRHTELIEEILGLVEEIREGKGSEPAGSD